MTPLNTSVAETKRVASRPRVSVVVPMYNESQLIETNIKRLLRVMSHLDGVSELLVVNDGSTDDTLEKGLRIAEEEPRLAMLTLVRNARRVLTDSGGLQKEAFWLGVPCVTVRDETEWVETLTHDWNQLTGADPDAIEAAVQRSPSGPQRPLGEALQGASSEAVVQAIMVHHSPRRYSSCGQI